MPLSGIREGDTLAAVDLGSNSFHLVVARIEHGEIRVIDRVRETVRMALGLRPDGTLEPERQRRALKCLVRFGQRLDRIPSERVRAVATNSVRRLRNPRGFLLIAETALGHPIEVVTGREEARLIYLGVAHGLPKSRARRLVIDIGGGSTEFIIGQGFDALETESLQMGCVASTMRFFADGRITRKRWQRARTEIEVELQQFAADYQRLGWREAIGSSGTARALGTISAELGSRDSVITPASLAAIREHLIEAGEIGRIRLPGLSEERRAVIAGGAVVMESAFEALGIDAMRVCDTAMREGLLYDLVGRAEHRDPRESSINGLAARHGTDAAQATRVERTALALFDQVAEDWGLDAEHRDWLKWCARVHEVGLSIAHSLHHHHGAYLVANSDLFGFTTEEQQALAFIVRAQRRAVPVELLGNLPARLAGPASKLAVLLRLAALLHRSRTSEPLPPLRLAVSAKGLRLDLPREWLARRPLTANDLEQERKHLAALDLALKVGHDVGEGLAD
jgi:exopolyphosphatase/guanosine-5'-triphosphate,3'-diphosphate pyrophosphatase